LRPIVRLMFLCGLGYAEFETIAKYVFVQVASVDYGIRGRPTNASRVAALTGLSRKLVTRIRAGAPSNHHSPDSEASPINIVLHYWNCDPEFSEAPGRPKVLPGEGKASFASLVKRYAGSIPPGALKTDLLRSGVVSESSTKALKLLKRYYSPSNVQDRYIRNMALSLSGLGSTLVHNAELVGRGAVGESVPELHGRFERCAFASGLSEEAVRAFQLWAQSEGVAFVERAAEWIGDHESSPDMWDMDRSKIAGVGIFFFVKE